MFDHFSYLQVFIHTESFSTNEVRFDIPDPTTHHLQIHLNNHSWYFSSENQPDETGLSLIKSL
jgi:hypothetical protein